MTKNPSQPPGRRHQNPRKRVKNQGSQRSLGWILWIVLPLIMGGMGWQWWHWAQAPVVQESRVQDTDPVVQIEIPPGTPAQDIGDRLTQAGIIRSSFAWNLWSRWLHLQQLWTNSSAVGGFQAGVYQLSPTLPLTEVAAIIWYGEVEAIEITIPEGWSLQQMARYFQGKGLFSTAEFLEASQTIPYDRFPWLPSNLPHLEGFLYPDTYALGYDLTPEHVIEVMLAQFEQVALPLHDQTPSSFTLKEWVTLASIVEKEAVLPQEQQRIAGVLINRLQRGMRLEVDPTVEYGLGIQQTPDSPLTLAEVRTPSPYNTYLNEGLPPTPIASPGQGSLQSILNPERNDYLYFVARYDGSHVFSTNFADHEAAQAQIRDQFEGQ